MTIVGMYPRWTTNASGSSWRPIAACLAVAGTTALPDHYNFDSWERTVDKRYRLIFTEKDAVKLWPRFPDALAVRLELDVEPGFFAALDTLLAQKQKL